MYTGEKCATLKQSQGITHFTQTFRVEMFQRWTELTLEGEFLSETAFCSSAGQSILCCYCCLFLFNMKLLQFHWECDRDDS